MCFTLLGSFCILAEVVLDPFIDFHDFCEALLEWIARIRVKLILECYRFWVLIPAEVASLFWLLVPQRRAEFGHLGFWVLGVDEGAGSLEVAKLLDDRVLYPESRRLSGVLLKLLTLYCWNMPELICYFLRNFTFVSMVQLVLVLFDLILVENLAVHRKELFRFYGLVVSSHHRNFVEIFWADDRIHTFIAIWVFHVILNLECLNLKLVYFLGELVVLLVGLGSHSIHVKVDSVWELSHFDVGQTMGIHRLRHWILRNMLLFVDYDVLRIIIEFDLKSFVVRHFLIFSLLFDSLNGVIYRVHPRHQMIGLRDLDGILLVWATAFDGSIIMAWAVFGCLKLRRLQLLLVGIKSRLINCLQLNNRFRRLKIVTRIQTLCSPKGSQRFLLHDRRFIFRIWPIPWGVSVRMGVGIGKVWGIFQ